MKGSNNTTICPYSIYYLSVNRCFGQFHRFRKFGIGRWSSSAILVDCKCMACRIFLSEILGSISEKSSWYLHLLTSFVSHQRNHLVPYTRLPKSIRGLYIEIVGLTLFAFLRIRNPHLLRISPTCLFPSFQSPSLSNLLSPWKVFLSASFAS